MKRHHILIIALATVAALAGGGAVAYKLLQSEPPHHLDVDRGLYPIKGIDISSHNGDIDFSLVAGDSIAFVYIKASEGATFRDSLFCSNYAAAQRAGIPAGVYHFFRFDCSGASQADNLLAALDTFPLPTLPVVIDLEEWGNPDIKNTAAIIREIHAMIRCLNANSIRTMIYTNKKGYKRFIQSYLTGLPLWICSFTNPPLDDSDTDGAQNSWTIWQHSHRGRVNGITGDVDINTFNGDSATFRAWLNKYSHESNPMLDYSVY